MILNPIVLVTSNMANPEASTQIPLLSSIAPESEPPSHHNPLSNDVDHGVQFYDPSAILDISRDVAFGYLILLTGGIVEYEPPTFEEASSRQSLPQDDSHEIASKNQRKQSTLTIDEESASLAYGAIVDGNVLHACFGLKATASGSPSIPAIGDNHNQLSLFCCFPSSSATLQLVLPQAAKNKLKMQNLVEILREVRDLHYEASGATVAVETAKVSLYIKVIRARDDGGETRSRIAREIETSLTQYVEDARTMEMGWEKKSRRRTTTSKTVRELCAEASARTKRVRATTIRGAKVTHMVLNAYARRAFRLGAAVVVELTKEDSRRNATEAATRGPG